MSNIVFGSPTVVSSLGVLTDQPVKFGPETAVYDQFKLSLDDLPKGTKYVLEAEIVIAESLSAGGLTLLFDTPTVRNIYFDDTGIVRSFGASGAIRTFPLGTKIDLRVDVDLAADTWEISLNGSSAHFGSFGGATEIRSIRFSSNNVIAGLDNLRVSVSP